MTLDHLWAGWRNAYVSGAVAGPLDDAPNPSGDDPSACVFCRIAASGPASPDNGVLWIGGTVMVVLNAYPYASGHLMAVPLRHVRSLDDLTEEESDELWAATRRAVAAQEAAYRPEGVNLGANLGEAAGAGIRATSTCTPSPAGRGTPTS